MKEKKGIKNFTIRQHARWLPADMETPISLFMGMVGEKNGILLESAEVDGRWGRYSILALDMAFFIYCEKGKIVIDVKDEQFKELENINGCDFIEGIRKIIQAIEILPPENVSDLPAITRALYGYFGFGMAGLFNKKLANVMPVDDAQCQLALPSIVLVFDHLYNRLCQISLADHVKINGTHQTMEDIYDDFSKGFNKDEIKSSPDEKGYKENVIKIREMLKQGEAIQVVPSVRFSCPFKGNSFNLYRKMRRFNASPYMFYMNFPNITLFGSSPEVMVRCTNGRLQLSPIAGTRRRGHDDLEDARLASELHDDPKERAEHVMLVDLGRNDLGRVARAGSVNLERFMEVERFSHVMHLTSQITARLADNMDAIDVLAATFPAGTVSGAPKIRAMEIIRELEGCSRGPYAGCIGWIGLDKDNVNLDTGITIRSSWVKDNTLYWQAGGGIVFDSDPELEWKEVCNKSAIMRLVLGMEDESNVSINR